MSTDSLTPSPRCTQVPMQVAKAATSSRSPPLHSWHIWVPLCRPRVPPSGSWTEFSPAWSGLQASRCKLCHGMHARTALTLVGASPLQPGEHPAAAEHLHDRPVTGEPGAINQPGGRGHGYLRELDHWQLQLPPFVSGAISRGKEGMDTCLSLVIGDFSFHFYSERLRLGQFSS